MSVNLLSPILHLATHQGPALQVVIPFFVALFSAVSFNKTYAWLLAVIGAFLSLIISLCILLNLNDSAFIYSFGGWQAPIGIEYRLDYLNQPIITFLNAILCFFLLFAHKLIDETIIPYIDKRAQHTFYSLLLFAHAGYIGVISTNDLFNIYVFIEISSLATYVLMSQGSNRRALVGAFDYLILGTIGATLILIGIGFLLALTGSLNITDIANILKNYTPYSSTIIVAITFFLTGAILKMAFFPMHFWMIRAYSSTAPIILTYLAPISSIIGTYIILRFMHFTIDAELIYEAIISILRPIALFTIVICSLLAFRADNVKKIVIYSAASQIGYIFLLMTIWSARELLFQLILLDSINKIALFTIISHISSQSDNLQLDSFISIKNSEFFKLLSAACIIFSAGLPFTSMFIVKLEIFHLLMSQKLYVEFVTVIFGSVIALFYYMRFVRALFFSPKKNGVININSNLQGLLIMVIIQMLTIAYIHEIDITTNHIEAVTNAGGVL